MKLVIAVAVQSKLLSRSSDLQRRRRRRWGLAGSRSRTQSQGQTTFTPGPSNRIWHVFRFRHPMRTRLFGFIMKCTSAVTMVRAAFYACVGAGETTIVEIPEEAFGSSTGHLPPSPEEEEELEMALSKWWSKRERLLYRRKEGRERERDGDRVICRYCVVITAFWAVRAGTRFCRFE